MDPVPGSSPAPGSNLEWVMALTEVGRKFTQAEDLTLPEYHLIRAALAAIGPLPEQLRYPPVDRHRDPKLWRMFLPRVGK